MRILFFSKSCNFCLKLLEYIDKNNLGYHFNLLCIDDINNIPKNISIVPTIISDEIEAPLEGKSAFEYVINQKYFNHPTNNYEYLKTGIPKPLIEEDKMANTIKTRNGFIYVNNTNLDKDDNNIDKVFNNKTIQIDKKNDFDQNVMEIMTERTIQDKKMQALYRLRK